MIKSVCDLRFCKWLSVATVLLMFLSSYLFSQKVQSGLFFSAGVGTNLNFHSAEFKSIPSGEACCQGFTNGFGLGENLFAGIEYKFPKKMFGREIGVRLNLAYSNLSADLTREEFIGNIITGNNHTQGISEHIVESIISMIMIEPQFIIFPLQEIPISTFAGFQFGIPLSMNYMQEERLISPDFGTYENGLTVRNHSDGEIPLPTSLYFALSIGARYELYKFGNFSILPELKFNLGLTNLTTNLDWKPSSLTLSAVLQYNPSVSETIPPAQPPPPVILPPPQPEAPELVLKAYYKGTEIHNGETINVNVRDTLFVTSYLVSPIIFFRENESEINENGKSPETQEEALILSIKAVKKYLENNPDANVTIISSSLENEHQDVTRHRVDDVIEKLDVDKNRIKQKNFIKNNNLKYPELSDENRFIKFDLGNNKQGLIVFGDTIVKSALDKIDIEIDPIIKSNDEYDFNGQIIIDDDNKISLNKGKQIYTLNDVLKSEKLKLGLPIQIDGKVKDKSSQEASAELSLNLKAEPIGKVVIENSVNKDGTNFTEYILGFCEFGKADFYSINQHAIDFTMNAVKSGKKIEIIPLTDSLGSADYNKNLAIRRAETAIKLLSLNKNNINVTIPDRFFFSNSTPEGRLLNRSVLVRIY